MKTFEDIKFKKHFCGIAGTLTLDSGVGLSIVAGLTTYCTPKEEGNTPDVYSSFEVAIFDKEGEFMDEPLGWQSREDINGIIEKFN